MAWGGPRDGSRSASIEQPKLKEIMQMRRLKVVILIVLVICLSSFTLLGKRQAQKRYVDTYVYEPIIRAHTINAPMPTYPEEASSRNIQGLVDLAVGFDENGKLARIKVLASPDPSITKAVDEALKQWTVKVYFNSEGLPVRTIGELRFHFVIRDGVASVENPTPEEQETRSRAFQKTSG
jgi:TonB family protein